MIRSSLHVVMLAGAALALALPAVSHETATSSCSDEFLKLDTAHSSLPGAPGDPVPFDACLGDISMQVTTANSTAQRYFSQGLALTWGFNHAEAIRSFRAAQVFDPLCAMCFWGEALALGPNIHDGMANIAIRPAWAAIQQARALASDVTQKEAALIEALFARYGANAMAQRPGLDAAWARAISDVARAWPDDVEILVLYADAMMNLQPSDYWEEDGVTPKGHGGEIVSILKRALALAPDHPGAAHLYTHVVKALAYPGCTAVADLGHVRAELTDYGRSTPVNGHHGGFVCPAR